jgi:hypothetical protein
MRRVVSLPNEVGGPERVHRADIASNTSEATAPYLRRYAAEVFSRRPWGNLPLVLEAVVNDE